MARRSREPDRKALFEPDLGYRPAPGVHDEMVDVAGAVRPVWSSFVASLSRMNGNEIRSRFARADRYLADAGVYYRVYGGGDENERDWPLSHIPLLIGEDEWAGIGAGIVQRAELLEAVCADIYGDNRLVESGALPPGLIAASPEFLRPMVGVRPASGRFLHFCSFELGRGPDGRWWVLADRAQAPSGAGFALENRVATTRAFSDIFAELHVHRLAGFFRAFRDSLQIMAGGPDGRVAILTPGPRNETYFEHAYIARYLGFMLLEGEDLTVVDGKVMVRTVAGLRPVSVLWRRLDASFADPLELNGQSRIGTPGIVQAVRSGAASIVNALGSGILETRALLAFLPALSRRLLGEELKLPGIATWWCGGEAERAYVEANRDRMIVGPALSTNLAFEDSPRPETASGEGGGRRLGPGDVGQEAVALSTTPVFANGRLTPRPVVLRVFAARAGDRWTVMPGGFARIGSSGPATAIAMQRGGNAADVWVVSRRPVEKITLLGRADGSVRRQPQGTLPSRAADNLFWLGRYIERAEGGFRILRAYHARLAEGADAGSPLLVHVRDFLEEIDINPESAVPEGLAHTVRSAVWSAGRIRDRFAPDGWLALNDLAKTVDRFAEQVTDGDDAMRAMTVLLRKLAGFAGLVHENMYRFTGWRFLEIGRRLERCLHMARLLGAMAGPDAPDGAYDMVIEIGDSVLTHRRRYSTETGRLTVVDLLALDALNPRSILHQLAEIRDEIALLPGASENGVLSPLAREAIRLQTRFAIAAAEDLHGKAFAGLSEDLEGLSDLLSTTYLA